jgi:hypothetical protein
VFFRTFGDTALVGEIKMAILLVRLWTPELPDGLRQNIGRDQGRRSDR